MSNDKIIKLTPDEYIAFTSEWADDLMKIKLGKDYEKYITYDKDGNSSYTEKGQEIFEDILVSVEQCMADLDIINKELNDV